MRKIPFYIMAAVLFLAGILFVFYPLGRSVYSDYENKQIIKAFQNQKNTAAEQSEKANDKKSYGELLEQMEAYNQQIYDTNQEGLKDAWSYQQNTFELSSFGLSDDMIGYISIGAMEIELPLYIGASEENMSKGAAVLGQTSMPIGGKNSNCVIAAHRGWKGTPMFREIEALKPGDEVVVTNLWESLKYKVVKTIVIDPTDIDAVKIIADADMLTLITCHPYTKNYQRYVVYCSRDAEELLSDQEIPYEGETYTSSENEIRLENQVNRYIMIVAVLLVLLVLFIKKGQRGGQTPARKAAKTRRGSDPLTGFLCSHIQLFLLYVLFFVQK